jgi:hypothetical protein
MFAGGVVLPFAMTHPPPTEVLGLPGTAAVFCTHDGFSTEARHYVITSPDWAQHLAGDRLW